MCFSFKAYSHPHVFVDAFVEFEIDKDGNLVLLKQTWEFDEMMSESLKEDNDTNADGVFSKEEIKKASDTFMKNMPEYDFYTHMFVNDKSKKIKKAKNFNMFIKDDLVNFYFEIEFENQINPFKDKVDIGLYDGEFFVDIAYKTKGIKVNSNKECKFKIFEDDKHKIYYDLVSPKTISVCRD
ncbi:MAG: hypothetical protein BWY78_00442 [Alphaproteobacteria bacterium ADurb.Bin438]|nr:MAG: hypothetical protein BWY78_00442 [Alphaproteobacteria bacterium ADurb.Bin438]